MARTFALALVLSLPLAAQVAETAGVTRVDVVVTDKEGNRIGGLDIADFTITENGQRREITAFGSYSADAKPAPAVTDTMYVPLFAAAEPTPPRRLTLLYTDAAGEAAAKAFVEKNQRAGDQVTMAGGTSDLRSRIAAAVVELARHPEKKALIVFGDASDRAMAFAMRRGITLYDSNTLANAAEDLASYYSISFRSNHAGGISIRTTRPLTVRPTAIVAPLTPDESVSDSVIAQHASIKQPNDLGIRLTADVSGEAGGARPVKLHVHIPIRNLLLTKEGEKVTGGFDVYVSLGDAKGGFSPLTKRTHAIDWPAAAVESGKTREIDFIIDVVMDPGRSHISVGVVDKQSKKTGFERIRV